jgi:hypothetical protein
MIMSLIQRCNSSVLGTPSHFAMCRYISAEVADIAAPKQMHAVENLRLRRHPSRDEAEQPLVTPVLIS